MPSRTADDTSEYARVIAAKPVAPEIHDKPIALLADVEELKGKESARKADRARAP